MSNLNKIFPIIGVVLLFPFLNPPSDTIKVSKTLHQSLNGLEVSDPKKLALYIEFTQDAKAYGIESIIKSECEKYLEKSELEIVDENYRSERLYIYFDLKKTILDTLPKTVVVTAEFYRPVYYEIENKIFDFVAVTWRESEIGYSNNLNQILEKLYTVLDSFIIQYFEANNL
ncbi:MAG: hypothetical protein ACXAC2_24740 [Candidatus Kariarchaeaceae archaeon]|jgi:hypothetical protein